MPITTVLGHHVAGFTYGVLSDSEVDHLKSLILDSIGCMVAATRLPQARMVIESSRILGSSHKATMIPAGSKASLARAVFVNSYCCNLLDADDTYANDDWTVVGHPGAVIIPVSLACAEYARANGQELLAAIAAGYDVAIRIGLATAPTPEEAKKIKGMGNWEIFGAAGAAAKLLGLSPGQCAHAFSIAGFSAPVPFLNAFYDCAGRVVWIKNNLGWVSLGGVMAAVLAREGMRGNLDLLDSGEFSRICGSSRWDATRVTENLGKRFMFTDISIKPYPACRCVNGVLDAVQELISAYHGSLYQDIESIVVEVESELAADKLSRYPSNTMDIPFSIPYLVAATLMGKTAGLRHVSSDVIHSDEMRSLCSRIQVVRARGQTGARAETYVKVTVKTKSGWALSREQDIPLGSPGTPLPRTSIEAKFTSLAEPVLGREHTRKILTHVSNLERVPDMMEACTDMFRPLSYTWL